MAKRGGTLLRPVQGVLLYGPPGCGKTALTRSLGKKCGLPIVQISPSTLLRKWVGDTSQLTKAVFTLCHKLQPCILFIDEMHTLVGAGKTDGAMDASNLLKPALARGELHCVGATTLDEYRKHI